MRADLTLRPTFGVFMTETNPSLGRRRLFSLSVGYELTLITLAFLTPQVLAQTIEQAPVSEQEKTNLNQQILQKWQMQTGQAGALNTQGQVEFHGDVTLDVYHNSVTNPSGKSDLTPLKTGAFEKIVLQGDVRSTSADEDVLYAQGVITGSNDRSVLARYANVANSVQIGRSGIGYQLSFGDVVAAFSGLGSNLGLRGTMGIKELGGLTVTGFAGTVAESWEALSNRVALDGLSPRTRYLRDVVGAKAEYKISGEFTGFMTLQNYHDRMGSADLPVGSAALDGHITTIGSKYVNGNLQVTAEAARSTKNDLVASTSASGQASIIDATYRMDTVALRSGYHDLDANFASLAQTTAAGIREWYVGADWTITPQLTYGVDVRDAVTRLAAQGETPSSQSSLKSLTNRVNYSLIAVPGLTVSVSDTRNKGKDALLNSTLNDTTQFVTAYANADWSANALVGIGRVINPSNEAADSKNKNWQLTVGRNLSDASAEKQAGWTLGLQATTGRQLQTFIVTGIETRTSNIGLNVTGTSQAYGNLNLGWQRQRSTQPIAGAANLTTDTLNLDWTKAFGPQLTMKAYAKINRRNHGDAALQVDERIIGVQGAFKW
jgi:hypothetical protein